MDERVDKILEIKAELEQMKSDCDQAKGAYARVLKQIQTKFCCNTLEAAKKLLRRMERKHERTGKRIDKETLELENELEENRG